MTRQTECKMLSEILHADMAPLKSVVLSVLLPLILDHSVPLTVSIFLAKPYVNNHIFLSPGPQFNTFSICLFDSYHSGLLRQAEYISGCKSPLQFLLQFFLFLE